MIKVNAKDLIKKIKELRDDYVPRVLAAQSEQLIELVHEGFDKQKSPYGTRWPRNKDGSKFDHLNTIRDSFTSIATDDSILLESDFPPAIFHQYGTEYIPAKPMIPTEELGLGNWAKPLNKTAKDIFQDIMK